MMSKNTIKLLWILVFVLGFLDFCAWIWPAVRRTMSYQWKPIIYLYPTETTEVTITLSHPENLTVAYPKYNKSWKVIADTNGLLKDSSGRTYYALYWEGYNNKKNSRKEDGFVVRGEDTVAFLEEKLSILGLNEREANEFIVFWLPKLEKNKWNYIRFQTMDEINDTMNLTIDPEPDTLIRIMMEYEPLNKKIEVKEQILDKVERNGFVVVEWGGTNIN